MKSPVGISTEAAALEDRRDRVRLLRPDVVAAVAEPEDTPGAYFSISLVDHWYQSCAF